MGIIDINGVELLIKEWNGQRVVTFSDIDKVHERSEGTARKRFYDNKERLIENEDYFHIKKSLMSEKRTLGIDVPNRGITVITESGYLMLVKSFTDDLAWDVQRKLVNVYFRFGELVKSIQEPVKNELVLSGDDLTKAISSLESCATVFQSMLDYTTINYKQQQMLLAEARERVNHLLGGAHSEKYKENSRMYFKNLWQDFCKVFECGSYRDLSPIHMKDEKAQKWIREWNYSEN